MDKDEEPCCPVSPLPKGGKKWERDRKERDISGTMDER